MRPKNYLHKIITGGFLALLITLSPIHIVSATSPTPTMMVASTPDVFITEVQTASATSASEEFIEFYNNTDVPLDFADVAHGGKDIWKLQYFSGSKITPDGVANWTLPTGTIDLSTMSKTIIEAHDYYLLATTRSDGTLYQPGGIEADGHYSPKLSDNTGLQLVDVASSTAVTTVHDRIAWEKVPTGIDVLTAPSIGSSLQRLPDDEGEYVLDTGLLTDLTSETPVTPRDFWAQPSVIDPDPVSLPAENSDPAGTDDDNNLHPQTPYITELLPNPASPQTDAQDEFIEIYNPNDTAIDLKGYTLETGTSTLHDFTFSDITSIDPQTYRAFYSADTHLSLSNSGSQVRLIDPANKVISTVPLYAAAADGKSWALLSNIWQWTDMPTPDAANQLTTGVATSTKASPTKTIKTKVKGVSTTKTAKVKTVKTKKPKATKKKSKKNASKTTASQLASAIQPTPIHTGVLAAVAISAVLYALYEFRLDVANYFYRFRSNHSFRRKSGEKSPRR